MIEGPSGLLSVCWSEDRDHQGNLTGVPRYEPSKRRLTWENGAKATVFSAEEADRLRGPNHDALWADELAAWKDGIDVWDMAMFGLRLGDDPRAIFTTTPRVTALIRRLMKDPATVLTRGSTYDNVANLAAPFLASIRAKYEGTRLGRQEIAGELLEDVPGALWTLEDIDKAKVAGDQIKEAQRIIVGVDPSGADGDPDSGSDDIGIVIAAKWMDGTFGVIEDASCNLSPAGWGRRVGERYDHHLADCIVAEKNFGGAMVEAVIKQASPNAKVEMVTASRGKAVRAEPIAALYEQKRVSHAPGLEKLEEQMMHMTLTGYVGEGSPDRLDAAVWALTELAEGSTYDLTAWST